MKLAEYRIGSYEYNSETREYYRIIETVYSTNRGDIVLEDKHQEDLWLSWQIPDNFHDKIW
jgi:hypothetical protein